MNGSGKEKAVVVVWAAVAKHSVLSKEGNVLDGVAPISRCSPCPFWKAAEGLTGQSPTKGTPTEIGDVVLPYRSGDGRFGGGEKEGEDLEKGRRGEQVRPGQGPGGWC